MPYYTCPNCSATIMPAEWAAGNCPRCLNPIHLTRGGARDVAEEDFVEAELGDSLPPFVLQRRDVLMWCTVRTGCGLLGAGAAFALLGGLFLVLMRVAADGPARPFAEIYARFCIATALTGGFMMIIAQPMVGAAPNQAGVREWKIALLLAFSLTVFSIVWSVLAEERLQAYRLLGLAALGLVVAHHCVAGTFAKVAEHFGARGLSLAWWIFLGVSGVFHVGVVIALLSLNREALLGRDPARDPFAPRPGPEVSETMVWIALAFATALLAWFLVQTVALRRLLTRQLLRAREEDGGA